MSKVTKSSSCVFNDLNVSHQNPCDELETVAYYRVNRTHLTHIPHKGYDELVTRQNAEEVIAAERAKKEKLEAAWLEAEGIISDMKADNAAKDREIERLTKSLIVEEQLNAAKDARIAELEAKLETANALVTCCCGSLVNDHDMGSGHSPVDQYHYAMVQLESDNKRLREALEPFADVADLDIGDDEDDMDVFWPISNERFSLARRLRVGDLRRASEALEEVKP